MAINSKHVDFKPLLVSADVAEILRIALILSRDQMLLLRDVQNMFSIEQSLTLSDLVEWGYMQFNDAKQAYTVTEAGHALYKVVYHQTFWRFSKNKC